MPTIPSDRPGSELRDLTGQISDGDDLPSAIDSALDDGVQVYIPAGEYAGSHSDLGFSADDATIYGDPAGVSIQCEMDSNATMDTAGTLRIENIDIRGKKPQDQVKIDVDLSGGRLEWINFNFPDATSDPTDSYIARCDSGTGHHYLQNCYFGPNGNSAFYYSERNTDEMDVTFKGCAFHNCAGPLRMGNVLVEDCLYLADGDVPDFQEEGSSSADPGTPRMFKFEGGGASTIRNTDILITEDAGPADGPCIDWGGEADDSNTIEVSNSRFGNFVGREVFDTASAPGGVAGDSSLSNVSIVSDSYFSGDEIPGEITSDEEPRTDIESRRWNPLEGASGGSEPEPDNTQNEYGLPNSFDVVTGGDATAPITTYEIWTPVADPSPPGTVSGSTGDSATPQPPSPQESELVVRASPDNPDTNCNVSVTADGEITFGEESESSTDTITDNGDGTYTATSVEMNPDAVDSYLVAGSITAVTVTDGYDVTVTLDGETLSLDQFDDTSDDPGSKSRQVVLRASPDNPDTNCNVSFSADGEITFGEESESGTDTITDNGDGTYTATSVEMNPDAVDSYVVSGTITDFTVTDGYEVAVLVDGQEVSIGDLVGEGNGGATGDARKLLVIDGTADADELLTYEFTVTGELELDGERTTVVGDGLPADTSTDSVENSTATGQVGNGRDVYQFTGQVQSMSLDGLGVVQVLTL